MKNQVHKKFGTFEITQKIGISPKRLRYWEKLGIVKPKYIKHGTRKFREYSDEDLHRSALVKTLVDFDKYTLEEAIRKLAEE